MTDPRTSHWFNREDDSPHLDPEVAHDLADYFELLLDHHTVEESLTAVAQMWPTIVYGEPYSGGAVVL